MEPEIRLGTLTNWLDLCDPDAHVLYSIDAPTPAEGASLRPVSGPIDVLGMTPDEVWANKSAIEGMLTLARQANRERRPAAERVMLRVRVGTTGWTSIDVLGGQLDITEILPTGLAARGTLTLACRPLFRGDAIQAQNLLAAPCDPTDAAWTRTNVTATADGATAPDGSTTAARLRETAVTGNHEARQQITKPAASGQYTGSVYVKPDGRAHAALWLADSTGLNGAYAGFALSGAGSLLYPAGTSGTGFSGASAAITDAGGGWYRVQVAVTTNADSGLRLYVQCHNGSGTSYAGDTGKGLLVWGAQVEEGSAAGLLLVPTLLPDTVWAAHTIPGYTYQETNYTADPDNLWSGAWDAQNLTQTTGQSDPSGGSGAERYTDNAATSSTRRIRNATAVSPSGLPRTYTFALYLKNYSNRNTPTIAVSTSGISPSPTGAYCTVNLTDGTFGTMNVGGSFALVSRETIDVGGGWWWVRLSVTVPSGSNLYGFVFPNGLSAYTGNTAYGVVVWRPQIVAGETIDEPIRDVVVDDDDVPAATTATGNPSGAWVYGIPGDAPALVRLELDDATTGGDAVNRVHAGGWSGPGVRLGLLAPFSLLDAAEGAGQASGSASQVGEWVPTVNATPTWASVGTLVLADDLRGRFDVVARVRDSSPNLSAPTLAQPEVADGIYARQVARVTTVLAGPQTSISLGIPVTQPGSTLVLMAQGNSTGTISISANGGLTWSTLHTVSGAGRAGFAAWSVANATPVSSTLTVSWSASMRDGTVSLIEITGAASSSLDQTDVDVLDQRNADTLSGTASVTTTQAAELLLSAGLGLFDWTQAFTIPIGDASWYGVSSLTSGAIYAKSVATTGTYTARWTRMVIDRGATPVDEGWVVTLAAFKAATSTGADIGTGRWSILVTALDANGVEGAPSEILAADVVASSSSVTVRWDAPDNGTPASYRVYRNRGTGWGYATVTAPTTIYTFTSETGLTSANPPTSPPVTAALRLAVALPSGETLWAGRAVSTSRANGLFEDVALGSVTLPPTVSGEGDTPTGALLVVQAAHLVGAPVAVNGVWLYEAGTGQSVVERARLSATTPLDWVIDTNRDEQVAAWLVDASGDEAGQLVQRVPGALVVEPGNALLVLRPQVAGGLSDLVTADLRVSRVVVTPRYGYLIGQPNG